MMDPEIFAMDCDNNEESQQSRSPDGSTCTPSTRYSPTNTISPAHTLLDVDDDEPARPRPPSAQPSTPSTCFSGALSERSLVDGNGKKVRKLGLGLYETPLRQLLESKILHHPGISNGNPVSSSVLPAGTKTPGKTCFRKSVSVAQLRRNVASRPKSPCQGRVQNRGSSSPIRRTSFRRQFKNLKRPNFSRPKSPSGRKSPSLVVASGRPGSGGIKRPRSPGSFLGEVSGAIRSHRSKSKSPASNGSTHTSKSKSPTRAATKHSDDAQFYKMKSKRLAAQCKNQQGKIHQLTAQINQMQQYGPFVEFEPDSDDSDFEIEERDKSKPKKPVLDVLSSVVSRMVLNNLEQAKEKSRIREERLAAFGIGSRKSFGETIPPKVRQSLFGLRQIGVGDGFSDSQQSQSQTRSLGFGCQNPSPSETITVPANCKGHLPRYPSKLLLNSGEREQSEDSQNSQGVASQSATIQRHGSGSSQELFLQNSQEFTRTQSQSLLAMNTKSQVLTSKRQWNSLSRSCQELSISNSQSLAQPKRSSGFENPFLRESANSQEFLSESRPQSQSLLAENSQALFTQRQFHPSGEGPSFQQNSQEYRQFMDTARPAMFKRTK